MNVHVIACLMATEVFENISFLFICLLIGIISLGMFIWRELIVWSARKKMSAFVVILAKEGESDRIKQIVEDTAKTDVLLAACYIELIDHYREFHRKQKLRDAGFVVREDNERR